MKTDTLRTFAVLASCLLVFGIFGGCDKAEQALKQADVGTSADLTRLIGAAVESVAGIKDLESAQAALPALQQIDGDLGPVMAKIASMAPEQKAQLTSLVTKALPQLEGAINGLSALPGVTEIVGPTLKSLQDRLSGLI